MRVGSVREVKDDEYRVGLTPAGVELLVRSGHEVLVEAGAGEASGLSDQAYEAAGARLMPGAQSIWAQADMVVKVKEPQPAEWPHMRRGQIVFTYFHFAADRELLDACLSAGIVGIAYETITDRLGRLPLLTPMSEVAGRMSIQEGAKYLERPQGGRGILLAGVPGTQPATLLILGGGVVGTNAGRIAAAVGAHVLILDVNLDRLRYLSDVMPPNVQTIFSSPHTIRELLPLADLVIGAVLVPGGRAPNLILRSDLSRMKPRSVIVDVCIDQGGCVETSRPTTHQSPTYMVDEVIHYCVANLPGAVSQTSTFALTNATLPYCQRIADAGYVGAARADAGLAQGINVQQGELTSEAVASAFGLDWRAPSLG